MVILTHLIHIIQQENSRLNEENSVLCRTVRLGVRSHFILHSNAEYLARDSRYRGGRVVIIIPPVDRSSGMSQVLVGWLQPPPIQSLVVDMTPMTLPPEVEGWRSHSHQLSTLAY